MSIVFGQCVFRTVAFKMRFFVSIILMGVVARSQNALDTLPTNFIPISYDLTITTHLEGKFTFDGTVNISTRCSKDADTIVLNSVNLVIDTECVAIYNGGKMIVPAKVTLDADKQLMYIKVHENLISGSLYDLIITFTGTLTEGSGGYYMSSYVEKATCQTRWITSTKFEPTSARSAFPCFDQPDMKASFKINLIHKVDLKSYSNMQLLSTENIPSMPGYVLDVYDTSPKMSTYLVSYVIADFASTETKCCDGRVVIRIIGRKDAVDQMDFAKKLAQTMIEFYEGYFNIKFTLPKLDILAVPNYPYDAIQNWGLILYRENELLVNPAVASISDKQSVTDTVTDEIVTQWVSDLVTLKSWSENWLKEGFTLYMGYLAEDSVFHEQNILQYITTLYMINVLKLDSTKSSLAIATTIDNLIKDHNAVDGSLVNLAYQKTTLLIRGINLILGEETFKQGVRDFLSKYQLSNAAADDFWGCLTDRAQKMGTLDPSITVKTITDNWIKIPNYPVVTVESDYSTGQVKLSQKIFLSEQSAESSDNSNGWNIPITWTTSSCCNFNIIKIETWLKSEKEDLTVHINQNEEWIILNLQLNFIYRVLYDEVTWKALAKTLNNPNELIKIHVLNRVQLITDSLSFAQIGDLNYGITFNLLNYLVHEAAFPPFYSAIDGLKFINKLLRRTPCYGIFQNYMRHILSNAYTKVHDMNVIAKDFQESKFKIMIISESCHQDNQECLNDALTMFNKWMGTPDPRNNNILPIDMRSIIYPNAIKNGKEEQWNFLFKQYLSSNDESEMQLMVKALACSSNTDTLKKYLDLTIKKNSGIRMQDAILAFNSMATSDNSNSDQGFIIAKDFLYQKVDSIYLYFGSSSSVIVIYINAIGAQIKTTEELKEFQQFISKSSKYLSGIESSVNQIIEKIKINIEWTSKNYPNIVTYM